MHLFQGPAEVFGANGVGRVPSSIFGTLKFTMRASFGNLMGLIYKYCGASIARSRSHQYCIWLFSVGGLRVLGLGNGIYPSN